MNRAQDQTKKEALFNEVKGSLFEYLVAKKFALASGEELEFHQSLDPNYLTVLSQQDRMVRSFYPEMLPFLISVAEQTTDSIIDFLKGKPRSPRLMGKFINSSLASELNEADLLVDVGHETLPISLKLNKKNAFVNTKSGGIKSFFTQYFSFLPRDFQESFNQLVDVEFNRMASELHVLEDLDYGGTFSEWVKAGHSELPGELSSEARLILKSYYARLAKEMHSILTKAYELDPGDFGRSLAPLMGFGNARILQVVCFHDFNKSHEAQIEIHPFEEVSSELQNATIFEFGETSSVEMAIGHWVLQIRIKPMNKFTTTAIKINCSVKVKK